MENLDTCYICEKPLIDNNHNGFYARIQTNTADTKRKNLVPEINLVICDGCNSVVKQKSLEFIKQLGK